METKVKRKINKKGLIFIILFLYLIGSFIYYLFTVPIKNIIVEGNIYRSDEELITESGLKDYPSILKVSSLKIKKNLEADAFIKSVVVKKNLLGKVIIEVKENKPLFYNVLSSKLVLEGNKEVDNNNDYLGMPTLVNYVPTDIYNDLIEGLSKIDDNIIHNISEIVYDPDKSGEIVFDSERFLLKMNDGNTVYINTPNIKKLNQYNNIYATVGGNGILYLDSSSDNYIFKKNE
jgi:cell division protein FtsQ